MSSSKKKSSLNHFLSTKEEIPINVLVESQLNNAYEKGWQDCKKAVLTLLQRDIQNCDLSTDSCDSRYIEMIKGL